MKSNDIVIKVWRYKETKMNIIQAGQVAVEELIKGC